MTSIRHGTHTPLYHKEVNDKVNTVNGKALIMVLDEVKRFDKFSIHKSETCFRSCRSISNVCFQMCIRNGKAKKAG